MERFLAISFFCLCLGLSQSLSAQLGCTDPNAHNYDPDATASDGSCKTCFDGVQNGDEEGVDCGGANPNCPLCPLPVKLRVEGNTRIQGILELMQASGDSSIFIGADAGH